MLPVHANQRGPLPTDNSPISTSKKPQEQVMADANPVTTVRTAFNVAALFILKSKLCTVFMLDSPAECAVEWPARVELV
jgi:hypothetical protein